MLESIEFDTQDFHTHSMRKTRNRIRRNQNRGHRVRESVRNANYQTACDQYKRRLSRKGAGRTKKIKGQTLSTGIPCNSRCTKSWLKVGYGCSKPLHEGFKHLAIWDMT